MILNMYYAFRLQKNRTKLRSYILSVKKSSLNACPETLRVLHVH